MRTDPVSGDVDDGHDVQSKGFNSVQFCKLQVSTAQADIKKWIYDCDHQSTWQRMVIQMAGPSQCAGCARRDFDKARVDVARRKYLHTRSCLTSSRFPETVALLLVDVCCT